ncbi:MAG: hypothetical protein ABIQ16_18580 [Polyangiaceae bacterium]
MNRASPLLSKPSVRVALLATVVAAALPALPARAAGDTPTRQAEAPSAKVETDTYLVEITAPGTYKPGATGTVRVTLTTKGAFHINGQFPYRFKAGAAPEGVTYPKPVLERPDAQFEEKKAVFNVPFVASHAGKFTVGGIFHLSVCSAGSCIVKKAPLEVSVNVQ